MILIITYDLRTAETSQADYKELFEEIKRLGSWWHYLESTWLVSTSLTPDEAFERIRNLVRKGDHVLISPLVRPYQGWLPQKAWDWIREHYD